MGPINLRYHVISLAAVFLALGVGIIVGSNTNFFGFSSLIDRQELVISRLEGNYKEIRKEVKEAKTELKTVQDRSKSLEEEILPKLLNGKLDGLRVGVVIVGQAAGETAGEEPFMARLKTAGAVVSYKMNLPLQRLQELADAAGPGFLTTFAGELSQGTAFGASSTDILFKEGFVSQGGFEQPVGAILVIIQEDQDLQIMRDYLVPMESVISESDVIIFNVVMNEGEAYSNIFRTRRLNLYGGVSELKGQVDVISGLAEIYIQKREHARGGA